MDKFKQFLKSIAPITDDEFEDTITFFTEQNLQKGEFFVKQDKVCRHIAFIVKGTLRTFYINNKSEETTSCFCTENSFTTSYKSFILQEPSNLSIQAIEETELLVIDYDNLQKLYHSSAIWQNIGRIIVEQEYIEMEKYASVLNNENAKEKYLRLLKEQPTVIQKAKVEDIASYLGVTRRTLSRIRQEVSK
ncbi:Crp/Fnr family transcriptional regulator [Sediminibacterium sp.]|uniref:Crp/Fnr family transcriptional regulator n=1 Tax=Sediminibacterium sp. TaxID=1917865 RepID=UPI0025F70D51|nr:Crp/Fnr family transcriptional regulator [Sediminibacterium sp.]MBW0177100.1 Crp/Fnr family transcriptional regulator [Sediminibacterium sp.]